MHFSIFIIIITIKTSSLKEHLTEHLEVVVKSNPSGAERLEVISFGTKLFCNDNS
jgi:hypothetical protein